MFFLYSKSLKITLKRLKYPWKAQSSSSSSSSCSSSCISVEPAAFQNQMTYAGQNDAPPSQNYGQQNTFVPPPPPPPPHNGFEVWSSVLRCIKFNLKSDTINEELWIRNCVKFIRVFTESENIFHFLHELFLPCIWRRGQSNRRRISDRGSRPLISW